MNMGVALYHHLDDTAGALGYFYQAAEKARAVGDTYLTGRILMNMGQGYFVLGELDAAQRAVSEAVDIRRQMGDMSGVAAGENLRTLIEVALGQVATARARAGRLMQESAAMDDARMRGGYLDTLALTQLVNGEFEAVIATLREALAAEVAGTGGDAKTVTDMHNHLALALLASGDLGAARQTLQGAPPAAGGADAKLERELVAGLVELASDKATAARRAFTSVVERAAKLGYQLHMRAARRLLTAIEGPPAPAELPGLVYLPEPA
jgi:tetratricopeptide (TPR) repeat protein